MIILAGLAVHIILLFKTERCLSSDTNSWSNIYSICDESDVSSVKNIASIRDNICSSLFEWNIDFKKQTFQIDPDSRTVIIKPVEKLKIDHFGRSNAYDQIIIDTDATQYATLTSKQNTIATFPGYFHPQNDTFCLDSIHFHWPSDHLFNAQSFALEAQFVHYSCEYQNLQSMLNRFQKEKNATDLLAVVSVMFDTKHNIINPAFDTILEELQSLKPHVVHGLDLSEIIPTNVQSAGYYTYHGAISEAPCADIGLYKTRFYVMNTRGYIGSTQMRQWTNLFGSIGHKTVTERDIIPQSVYACMDLNETVADERTTRSIVWGIAIVTMLTPIILGIACIYQNTDLDNACMKPLDRSKQPPPPPKPRRAISLLESDKKTHTKILDTDLNLAIDRALSNPMGTFIV